METFEHDGLPIRFARAGAGEPVVCLHNGGTSHAIWNELAAALAPDYEIFSLDLLGYGASAKPGTGYGLDRHVAILDAFVDAHRLAPVRLIGNCMGSAISLTFATRRPHDVSALVLVNPLTTATFTAGWLGPWLRLRRRAPRLSRALYARLGRLKLGGRIARESLRFQLGSAGRARRVHDDPALCACYTGSGQMASLLGALDDLVNYAALDRLEPGPDFPPICTIWGLENKVLSASAGSVLNQRLRPQREEWLARCGHLPMRERPDEVAAIVRDFFASTPRRRELAPAAAAVRASA
jgi:pimeloyl-ACP methyl ester carboxylesterase